MSFVDDVKEYLSNNPKDVDCLTFDLDCRMVDTEVHDERRWYNIKHTVFEQYDETTTNYSYVLVEHCEPATELQEGGDFPEPEVFAVEPYIVEVVKYRPV